MSLEYLINQTADTPAKAAAYVYEYLDYEYGLRVTQPIWVVLFMDQRGTVKVVNDTGDGREFTPDLLRPVVRDGVAQFVMFKVFPDLSHKITNNDLVITIGSQLVTKPHARMMDVLATSMADLRVAATTRDGVAAVSLTRLGQDLLTKVAGPFKENANPHQPIAGIGTKYVN